MSRNILQQVGPLKCAARAAASQNMQNTSFGTYWPQLWEGLIWMNFFGANIETQSSKSQLIESSLIQGSQCLVPRKDTNETLAWDMDFEDVRGHKIEVHNETSGGVCVRWETENKIVLERVRNSRETWKNKTSNKNYHLVSVITTCVANARLPMLTSPEYLTT